MSKTVVGLFSSMEEAQRVKQQIISSAAVRAHEIKVIANHENDDYAETEHRGSSIGDKVSHFFKSLTGGDEDVHNHYANGLNGGGALLTVKADDDEAQGIVVLLRENGARDIENGNVDTDTGYNDISAGYPGTTSGLADATGTAATGYANTGRLAGETAVGSETAIPVVEESLVVGKREVDRGAVRVYSHVVEEPVSADVNLRDEVIRVERRAVNRPATTTDFASDQQAFEVRASGEEAVVGKTARVVEEVLGGKETTEHTQAVRDTVRHTEVDVEELPGSELRTSTKSL